MIGTIDVKVQAHNPNFPLDPVFTFVNSSQSFRIRDVPKRIGNWSITNVFVNITYPDNTVISKECLLVGGVWVGTVNGCSSSGQVEKGFVVTASGIDENNQTVSNYVLGAGDIYVKQLDGTVTPGKTSIRMFFYETIPTSPNEGDSTFIEGILNVYDGTQWKPALEVDLTNYYTKAEVDETFRNKTDLNVYEEVICPWIMANGAGTQYTFVWNAETQLWEVGNLRIGFIEGVWKYGIKAGTNINWINTDESSEDTLTLTFSAMSGSREAVTKKNVAGTLATQSDLPTKTSDLTNDSGFITAEQVPTPSYIENTNGNKIQADLSYSNLNWTGWRIEGTDEILTGEKGEANNMPTNPEVDDEYYLILFRTLDSKWELDRYIWTGSAWNNNANAETSGTIEDTTVDFVGWQTLVQVNESGKLATNSEIPTKTSDLTNDSGFITSAEIEPYHEFQSPTENTGLARMAMFLGTTDESLKYDDSGYLNAIVKFNSQNIDPYISLDGNYIGFWPWTLFNRLRAGRYTEVYYGFMWRTKGIGFAIPCNEDGIPDGRLFEITKVEETSPYRISNSGSENHTITGNQDWGSIETIDGQTNQIVCTRAVTLKNKTYVTNFASKDDIPTKTSDLTNDSGFITSSQIPTPSYIEDTNGRKIEADLDCITQDLTLPWTLVDGQDTYTLNYDEQTSNWRYEEAETKKIELSYGTEYSIWELDFYLWNNGEWRFDTGSTTMQDENTTSLTILEWTLTRNILKNNKLATQEYVDAQIGQVLTEEF